MHKNRCSSIMWRGGDVFKIDMIDIVLPKCDRSCSQLGKDLCNSWRYNIYSSTCQSSSSLLQVQTRVIPRRTNVKTVDPQAPLKIQQAYDLFLTYTIWLQATHCCITHKNEVPKQKEKENRLKRIKNSHFIYTNSNFQ